MHEQAALALADRRDHVDDAAGDVFLGFDLAFELQRFGGDERGKIFEEDLVLGVFRWLRC